MPRTIPLTISLTETPQFKRLVEFASDVQEHASETHDFPLLTLVDDLHRDLLEMSGDE